MASEKRCHYEVLGLSQDCTPDEIRSAYKKLALQRHPDKLMRSGLSQAEATAQFQELSQAYEVLSDSKERAWYDSHRSQILFSDPNSTNSVPGSGIPNLFSFFSNTVYSGYTDTGKGFYKVFSDVFNKIYANEISFCKKLGLRLDSVREAPVMGNLDCPYAQVTAFYNYWLSFCTVMDFCWVDQYDVMAGPNRKSRRVMEDENIKLRKKAKREYNETVRGLADFVKKRDKRVIDMMIKKNAEIEKKKIEERERKKKLERERMERARAYEEPEWARVDEQEVEEMEEFEEEEKDKKENGGKELYCVVCGKKFKSEKQWKNHEQSKKHKEKVAELKQSFVHEEKERKEDTEGDEEQIDEEMVHNVNEMEGRFREGCTMTEEENDVDNPLDNEENGFFDAEESDEVKEFGVGDQNGDEDEDGETSVLEAMLSGHKGRKSQGPRDSSDDISMEAPIENVENEVEVMEYNNRKSRRRKGKKDRGKNDGVPTKSDFDERSPDDETNGHDEQQRDESPSHPVLDGNDNDHLRKNQKNSYQQVDNKGAKKKELNVKSKNLSKGKKGKAASKNSGNLCESCGEEFESRNKLHKHLSDTGHASLKHR
ncbi:DNAJ protein JJJ1 homolog [Euphorbia lathyris]|uniref:DNAJ protein JJJ1 homolog n=1 Tax=Euphorbia lathyris TaxID=212925 RepID=UPI003313B732